MDLMADSSPRYKSFFLRYYTVSSVRIRKDMCSLLSKKTDLAKQWKGIGSLHQILTVAIVWASAKRGKVQLTHTPHDGYICLLYFENFSKVVMICADYMDHTPSMVITLGYAPVAFKKPVEVSKAVVRYLRT